MNHCIDGHFQNKELWQRPVPNTHNCAVFCNNMQKKTHQSILSTKWSNCQTKHINMLNHATRQPFCKLHAIIKIVCTSIGLRQYHKISTSIEHDENACMSSSTRYWHKTAGIWWGLYKYSVQIRFLCNLNQIISFSVSVWILMMNHWNKISIIACNNMTLSHVCNVVSRDYWDPTRTRYGRKKILEYGNRIHSM